jgi:arabinofuranosyltransferase
MDGMTARTKWIVTATALALLLVVLVRTAWVCDDAYITFRSVEQWLHGHGPRWNMDERVQAFSHPLWFLALTAVTAIVREPYVAALILGLACSIGMAAMVLREYGRTGLLVALILAILLASHAFIDFSTSGLENPLSSLLLAAFAVLWLRPERAAPDEPRARRLTVIAALLLTTRLDVGVLVLPALAVRLAALPWRAGVRAASIGLLPLVAWEVFSLVYYGFLLPNTAYAKLWTGIPVADLARQAMAYFLNSLQHDPVTLPVIAAGLLARPKARWPLALGLLLYLGYVVRVGGDFMSGRFFVAPFVLAAVMLVDLVAAARMRARTIAIVTAAVLLLGAGAPRIAAFSGSDYGEPSGSGAGIQDERGYYYPITGLLRPNGPWTAPITGLPRLPGDLWPGHFVAVQDVIGIYGYQAPLTLHIIDIFGLADPLLSRLPCQRPWRIGHFMRALPEGYVDTVESRANHLRDPSLAAYYDQLSLVVRGPLWSRRRLSAILQLNLGRYDHLLPAGGR